MPLPYYEQLKHWALKDDMRGFDCLGAEEWFPAPTLAAVRGGVASIRRGHSGDSVMYVQGLAGAIADGKFGEGTEKAVKAFQSSRKLSATGVVDSSTMAALDVLAQGGTAGVSKIDFSKPTPAPQAPASPAMTFTPDVVTLKSPNALAKTTPGGEQPSWWMQPAWQGTDLKRAHVAAIGAGSVAVLGGLLALLFSSSTSTTVVK